MTAHFSDILKMQGKKLTLNYSLNAKLLIVQDTSYQRLL